jgi:CHAT domain-containing protein
VIELAQQLGEATEAAGMRRDHARVLELSARALLQTDHREEATDVARRSIALLDELELPARAAQARLALAAALPPEDALTEVRRALDSYDEAGEKWGVAAAAVLGAEIASELDEPSAWSRTAVSTQAAEYPELHWRLETALGRSAMADGRVDAARRHHQESLDTLRSLRSGVHAGLDRVPFMSNRRSSLEAMVSLLLDEGDVAAARTLSSAERAWSMVTADEASEPIPGTVLYQMLDDQLSAFVTTEDGATTHLDLDVDRATLDYSRRRIQSQWRRIADRRMRVHLDQLRPAANAVFQELYLAIFEPIDRLFGEEFPITVVPVGSLSGIPFGLLHDGLSYMIERRAIHVTPHEGIPIRETGRRTLVVGVPDAVAPEIEREALQVAEVTGGELILGRDATRAAVCEAMPEFDVIHLAGHGRYRSDDAGLSGVALADGWLTAQEIQHVGLDGQLVVLAACSSGLQRSMGEDEALGLPRALLAAGAGSVVMNLWPADDLASVGLMTSFHSNLHAFAPHDALRRAQFSAMSNHPHPLLWGAPVLYGPQPALTTYEEFSHATAQTNR